MLQQISPSLYKYQIDYLHLFIPSRKINVNEKGKPSHGFSRKATYIFIIDNSNEYW